MSRHHAGPRGPYNPWCSQSVAGSFGAFLFSRRLARKMTQAKYAAFLGVSLRTYVTAEKDEKSCLPWQGSQLGCGLKTKEFSSWHDLEIAFATFKKEAGK